MACNVLKDKELSKLAAMTGVSIDDLTALYDKEMLDVSQVRKALIKADYLRLGKDPRFTKAQIAQAIAIEYGTSLGTVNVIVYDQKTNASNRKCKICGTRMTKYKFTKSNGICDDCIVPQIDI